MGIRLPTCTEVSGSSCICRSTVWLPIGEAAGRWSSEHGSARNHLGILRTIQVQSGMHLMFGCKSSNLARVQSARVSQMLNKKVHALFRRINLRAELTWMSASDKRDYFKHFLKRFVPDCSDLISFGWQPLVCRHCRHSRYVETMLDERAHRQYRAKESERFDYRHSWRQ